VKRASIPTQGAGAEVGPIKQDLDPVAAAELQVRLAAIEDQATGAGSEDGPRSSAVGQDEVTSVCTGSSGRRLTLIHGLSWLLEG
jgi:hypothetical protein